LTSTQKREPCPGGCGRTVRRVKLSVPNLEFNASLLVQCPECWAREAREDYEREVRRELAAALIPKRMSGWTLASHPQLQDAVPVAEEWLRRHAAGERHNLLLFGPVGTGKTGLAVGVLRAFIEGTGPDFAPATEESVEPGEGLFLNFRDFLAELRRSYSTGAPLAVSERARRAPLLVLDDLGAERPTAHARDELAVLVEHRHGHELPTVVTSNYEPGELARRLGHDEALIGHRIVSRLTQGAMQVRLIGPDRRLTA
jgi:DNA replication protein DnaC